VIGIETNLKNIFGPLIHPQSQSMLVSFTRPTYFQEYLLG